MESYNQNVFHNLCLQYVNAYNALIKFQVDDLNFKRKKLWNDQYNVELEKTRINYIQKHLLKWVEVAGKTAAQKAALGKILNYKPTRPDVPPPCPTDFTVPVLSMETFGFNVEPQSRHKRCRTTSANDYSSAIPSTSTEAYVQQSLRNAGPVDNTTEVVGSNFHNHSLNSLLLQQNSLVTQLSSGITTQLATENRNVSDTSVPNQFNQVDTEISADNRVLLSLNEAGDLDVLNLSNQNDQISPSHSGIQSSPDACSDLLTLSMQRAGLVTSSSSPATLQLGDHSTTCEDVRTANSDSRDSSGLSQAAIMILPPNTTSLELCDETEVTFEGEQNREADTSRESSYELIFEDQNMSMFLDGNQFLNHLDGAETDPVDVLLTTNEELDYNDFGNTLTIAGRPADEGYQCANVTYDDISQTTLDSPQPGSTFTLEGRNSEDHQQSETIYNANLTYEGEDRIDLDVSGLFDPPFKLYE